MNFPETDKALLQLGRALKTSGYSFTTSTPLTHARVNARPENAWAKNLRDVFGWSRPFQREVLSSIIWDLMNAAQIVEENPIGFPSSLPNGFRSSLRLSSLSGESFWHSAFPTSQSDAVFFGPDTYRYANAIENFIARKGSIPFARIVDIGSGSGAGAILAARAFPDAEVVGVDINEEALRLTRINAELVNVKNVRAQFSDLLNDVTGNFDLILANPPYLVDDDERAYRHGGGPLGSGLSLEIVEAAKERLAPNGTLLLYTGAAILSGRDPFREEVEAQLQSGDFNYSYSEVDPDVFGEELENGIYRYADRIAAVVLTATRS